MGFFNKLFSKKEETPHYDSTNIRIQDLDLNFVFEYDLSTWKVEKMFEYDWGDNYFTQEYQIYNGEETLYLGVEDDDELEVTIGKKIKLRKLGATVVNHLMEQQTAPSSVVFQDEKFILLEEAPGYCNDVSKGEDNWEEFIAWDFENEAGTKVLTIEQWGEKEFEASIATYIKPFEISNILPASE